MKDWIPSSVAKPEELRDVLIFDDEMGLVLGYYFELKKTFIGSVDGAQLKNATYWMPLPEMPLDKGKKFHTPHS